MSVEVRDAGVRQPFNQMIQKHPAGPKRRLIKKNKEKTGELKLICDNNKCLSKVAKNGHTEKGKRFGFVFRVFIL